MQIEFDERKAENNLRKHGVSLEFAAKVFSDPRHTTRIDQRRDYGEVRFITTGSIERRIYVLVYTVRDETVRLISGRKANEREKNTYRSIRTRPQRTGKTQRRRKGAL